MAWYDAELLKTPYVVGSAIYCCGVADSKWQSYDIWQGVARALSRRADPVYRLSEDPPFLDPVEPADPVEPPASRWKMEVEHLEGPRIIAGTLPESGIEVSVADPWGNASMVMSGSKSEYGVGGFEVLAPHVAAYTVSFLDESFELQTKGLTTLLTFVQVDEAVEDPEPVQEPPVTTPPSGPAEPVEEPPEVVPPVEPAEEPQVAFPTPTPIEPVEGPSVGTPKPAPVKPAERPSSGTPKPAPVQPAEEPPAVALPPLPLSPVGEGGTAKSIPEEPIVGSETPLTEEEMMALIFERLDDILALLKERL